MARVANLPAATATSSAVVVDVTSMGVSSDVGLDRRRRASEMAFMIVGFRDGLFPVDSRTLSPDDDDDDDDGGVSEVLECLIVVCKLRRGADLEKHLLLITSRFGSNIEAG